MDFRAISEENVVFRFFFASVMLAGAILTSRPKLIVLYLRKFRRNTEIINPAYQGCLGRRFRILTLYDGIFQPIDLPSFERWLSYIIQISAVVIAVVVISLVTTRGWPSWLEVDGTPLDPMWQAVALSTSYLAWLLSTIVILFLIYRHRLQWANPTKITSAVSISSLTAVTASMTAWWQRPTFLGLQSTIVDVDSAIWRETVSTLLSYCNATVVDITETSDALAWELSQLRASQTPFVLIREDAGATAETASVANQNAILEAYARQFGVVEYSRKSKDSIAQFKRELRAALIALQPKKIGLSVNYKPSLVRIIFIGLRYFIYILCSGLLALPLAMASYTLGNFILAPT